MLELEEFNTSNPNAFWNHLHKFGPIKSNNIQWKVDIDGEIHSEKEKVLEHWKNQFKELYFCIFFEQPQPRLIPNWLIHKPKAGKHFTSQAHNSNQKYSGMLAPIDFLILAM